MLGHTLDLFIAGDSSRLLWGAVVDSGLTDPSGNYSGGHFAIVALLNFIKPSRQRKTVTFRKYASINLTDFKTGIRTALKTCLPHNDAASLEIYTRACSDTIDLHAPLNTSRSHSTRHSMVYKRTVACKNPSKKAWTVLAKDRISYTSGFVQGSVRSCGTPHLGHEEKIIMKEYWMNVQVIQVNFSIFLVDYLD